jgi:hypothetical protein
LLQHQRDQIHTVAEFRDPMLDLESRVHLQEEEIPRGVIDEKLDRAGGFVFQLLCVRGCASGELGSHLGTRLDEGTGTFFNDLSSLAPQDRMYNFSK